MKTLEDISSQLGPQSLLTVMTLRGMACQPEKFNPERFSPEVKSPIQQSVFFPFALGPRNCIGQTFAQFEARIIMARFLQEFELTLLPGQNEIKHEARLTIRPKGGVLCTIKRRGENQKKRI